MAEHPKDSQTCSKPFCKNLIIHDDPHGKLYQRCQLCWDRDRLNAAARREKRKLANDENQLPLRRVRVAQNVHQEPHDPHGSVPKGLPDPTPSLDGNVIEFEGFASDNDADDDGPVSFKHT
jgi:hypothetical protein